MDRFLNTFRILEEEEEVAAREREELQLEENEGDAFLPGGNNGPRRKAKEGILTRWMPPRIKQLLGNASRMKLVIGAMVAFLLFLGSISYLNRKYKLPVSLPDEALFLSRELLTKMNGTGVPDYVLTYAPLVFLDKKELFFPSDLATHLSNTYAASNLTPITDAPSPLTLSNLDLLNPIRGTDTYLSSTPPLTTLPAFLRGQRPSSSTLQTPNATSSVIIIVDHGLGIIDAYYMYFYSFNNGPSALGHQAGSHVGDWEHNLIRFHAGVPEWIWYSQHDYGTAYTYGAVDKIGERPVVFSARGSHANYATAEKHDYHNINAEIPRYIVYDYTSPGQLWDPTLQALWYSFDIEEEKFTGVLGAETPFLYFKGQWGDDQLAPGMPGQEVFKGFWKWTAGPRGPLDKHLDRVDVCLPAEREVVRECIIKDSL